MHQSKMAAHNAAAISVLLKDLTRPSAASRIALQHGIHVMLYVALGRVTAPANLRVGAPGNLGGLVVNVVYVDVLEVGEAREAEARTNG
jgi:hypothetical protein